MEVEIEELYKPATRCRIYAWELEQLYFGPIPELGIVQYSSPVLRVGLNGGFYVRFSKRAWVKYNCIFIPAGVTHEVFPAKGIVAKYWVEKESNHHPFFLKQLFLKAGAVESQKKIILDFQYIYENKLNHKEAREALNTVFQIKASIKQELDSRILKISEIIRREPDYNFSIEFLASEVDLSASRLLHLIKEETGSSYRKFRMWQRLRYAVSILGSAHSLTYAAVEAGFNDASHFTRCFKARYGVTPSSVHRVLEMYEISDKYHEKV